MWDDFKAEEFRIGDIVNYINDPCEGTYLILRVVMDWSVNEVTITRYCLARNQQYEVKFWGYHTFSAKGIIVIRDGQQFFPRT